MHAAFHAGLTVVLLWGSTCFANDPIVWDNGPLPVFPDPYWILYSSAAHGDATGTAAADDFLLSQDTFITGAQWSGSVEPFQLLLPDAFILRFYTSDPSGTTPTNGLGDDNAIDSAIAMYVIPGEEVTVIPDPGPGWEDVNFHFAIDLPMPFIANAGEHYWFSVQGQFELSGTYAPMFSTSQQLNVPAWSNGEPWESLDFDGELPPSDLAFKLYGTPVPAPGALATLSLAGLLARRRRR